ncbi:hypothetical protein ACU8OQ_25705 (plasmid) [Rhizobium leguminosarum]
MQNDHGAPGTWAGTLAAFSRDGVFADDFLAIYGARNWEPNAADQHAAHLFHVQLISRIATQPLNYSEGMEDRALTSIVELFKYARDINGANPDAATFEILAWYILNVHVRPFTAKWHPKSASGALHALDTSDEFRTELAGVQAALIALDGTLQLLRASAGYEIANIPLSRPNLQSIDEEMSELVHWRPMGNIKGEEGLKTLAENEQIAVGKRRSSYGIDRDLPWATGLALSGGGIRSAAFALGAIASIAKRNLLCQFDYLSTVSGGGYAGTFLTQLVGGISQDSSSRSGGAVADQSGEERLQAKIKTSQSGMLDHDTSQAVSLCRDDQPFRREEGESELLRQFRQSASFLSGSPWERMGVAMAQAYGIFMNLAVLMLFAALFAFGDFSSRRLSNPVVDHWAGVLPSVLLAVVFLAMPMIWARPSFAQRRQFWMALLAVVFLLPLVWLAIGLFHTAWHPLTAWSRAAYDALIKEIPNEGALSALLAALASVSALAGALLTKIIRARPVLLTILILVFFATLETALFNVYGMLGFPRAGVLFAGVVILLLYLWLMLDVNAISLHGYYRQKLATAFLVDKAAKPAEPMRLSDVNPELAHFPIINCAVNLPGSKNASMRGRLSDVFAFTPVATGSPVLGYEKTKNWEGRNPSLDLATAMALSGAAVSPQMGLRTTRYASFWLTVLNLRLGAWLRRTGTSKRGPGISHLFRELTATADEAGHFVNISDGGHIENLGVYELLRRRCRYIVAIDGENDPQMTFHALTNLQRLAYIDHGIVLELNLDDLRLSQAGLSRSHFHFCRILYPKGLQDADQEIGYLVYLKLSLTGNEGEFLRRYKIDEPAFPHHSTADQFFSETQFEAYRALGEHVGEKMFLPAIAGRLGQDVRIEDWFFKLGLSLLSPRPSAKRDAPAAAP